jgi:hypothetical protein
MSAFLSGVPVWVWVVLALLVRTGVAAARPNAVALPRLAMLPVVFSLWSLRGLDWQAGAVAGMCGGAAVGWLCYRRMTGFRLEGMQLHRPGSWRQLGTSLLAFALKFTLGALAARGVDLGAEVHDGVAGFTCAMLWAAALTQLWLGRPRTDGDALGVLAGKVARGTLPLVAFSLLLHVTPLRWLILVWIALILFQVVAGWQSLKSGEPLSWVALVLFAAMFANGYTNAVPLANLYAASLCYAVFSLTAVASVLAGAPFTAVHARRTVPSEMWRHPVFIRINRVLSLVWALVFAVNGLLNIGAAAHPVAAQAACMLLLAGAIVFSDRYPLLMRRRAMARAAAAPAVAAS